VRTFFPLKRFLLVSASLVFAAASAQSAIIARAVDSALATAPFTIVELNTVISSPNNKPEYHYLNSSNDEFWFVRHVESWEENICYYWFRADGDPTKYSTEDTEHYSDVYWYVGGSDCTFVDGAEDGSNNFVLLRSTVTGNIVGVLQYELNASNSFDYPARLLAYAVDPNGMTFFEGVAAIQAIPEPSTMALVSLALVGGVLKLRRRQ
jgi:hypothetical protein